MIAQNEEVLHRRATAVVTIAAGVTSLASLIIGLSGADFDFEAVSEAATFIALGTDAVAPVRWGLWLSMFGSYLLLVPVALLLLRWLRQDDPVVADLATVAAGFYILLGAAGASVLASTLPDLIQQYADADAALRAGLLNDFDLARRIGEDGLQGVVQNVAGAAWFAASSSTRARRGGHCGRGVPGGQRRRDHGRCRGIAVHRADRHRPAGTRLGYRHGHLAVASWRPSPHRLSHVILAGRAPDISKQQFTAVANVGSGQCRSL
jgi:hypothetical protein